MRNRFWWWVHDRLEGALCWIYRSKLQPYRPYVVGGCIPPGSVMSLASAMYYRDPDGIIREIDGSAPPATVQLEMDRRKILSVNMLEAAGNEYAESR